MIAAGLREYDAQIILDLIFGAFYYRMLMPYAPINEEWVAEIVYCVLPQALLSCPNARAADRYLSSEGCSHSLGLEWLRTYHSVNLTFLLCFKQLI